MKRTWKYRPTNETLVQRVCSSSGCSPLVAHLLALRGLERDTDIRAYLSPLDCETPSPFLFSEMDVAVQRILRAIERRERVLVHGDYDVDGITGTAILQETLLKLGVEVEAYLPDRLGEGYGLQTESMADFAGKYDLIITVDCGTTSYEAIEEANRLGLEVIVTDHHDPGDRRPDAVAVLNPIRPGEPYPSKNLSGAGVAWKLACALRSTLYKVYDPDEQLELVAMGMIADIVPILGENRSLLVRALNRFQRCARPGLMALMDLAKVIPTQISTYSLSHQLGPRLNAAGRMDHPRYALDLLLTQEESQAHSLARHLHQLNEKRRKIEQKVTEEAIALVEENRLNERSEHLLVVTGDQWHRGVLGIIAQRLVMKYQKPVFLLSREGEIAFGSARTVDGANLIPLLDHARLHAVSCGGHMAAAGMKVRNERIEEFEKALYEAARMHWARLEETPLWIDAQVTLEQVNEDFMGDLERFKPFGKGNDEPVFYAKASMNGMGPRIVGNNHLSIRFGHVRGTVNAIGFNLGYKLDSLKGRDVELAFKCRYNDYQGRREINLHLVDIRSLLLNVIPLPVKKTEHVEESPMPLDRQSLGRVYRLLSNAADEERQVPHQHAFMLGQLEKINREEFDTALTIFHEIGLLTIKEGKIKLIEPTEKRDLSQSPTYRRLNGQG